MLRGYKLLAASAGALAVAGAGAVGVASKRFRSQALSRGEALSSRRGRLRTQPLPPLLEAYLEHVGVKRGTAPRRVRLEQQVELRQSAGERWEPLTATQLIALGHPAFLWHAAGKVGPFDALQVVDAYDGQHGWLEARIAGLVPVARARGPEADKGELMRYLAELPWAPHALLWNPELEVEQTSERAVEVSVRRADQRVSVRLDFDERGEVVGAYAPDRPRAQLGQASVPGAWSGSFGDYLRVDGLSIPTRVEVAWQLPEGELEYFRGRITRYRVE